LILAHRRRLDHETNSELPLILLVSAMSGQDQRGHRPGLAGLALMFVILVIDFDQDVPILDSY
jgi:hypothetical protein